MVAKADKAEKMWKEAHATLDICQELATGMGKEMDVIEKERRAITQRMVAQKERTDHLIVQVKVLRDFVKTVNEDQASRMKSIE